MKGSTIYEKIGNCTHIGFRALPQRLRRSGRAAPAYPRPPPGAAARRRASQPLEMPSAGSTFKRPQTGYAAAIIEAAGLKGKGVGRAAVSEKHAGFVVNLGGATARDVLDTMDMGVKAVADKSGIVLEPEVRILRDEQEESSCNLS